MTLTDQQNLKLHLASLINRRDFLARKAEDPRALAELAALIYVINLLDATQLSDSQKDSYHATTTTGS